MEGEQSSIKLSFSFGFFAVLPHDSSQNGYTLSQDHLEQSCKMVPFWPPDFMSLDSFPIEWLEQVIYTGFLGGGRVGKVCSEELNKKRS